ncbi:hypothetical protein NL676_038389 [Syzygium grande]|nr:hypothetical protein NL676_038389 [Syzygium grande]
MWMRADLPFEQMEEEEVVILTFDRATAQPHSQAPDLRSRNPDHPRNHLFLQLLCEARQELWICKQFAFQDALAFQPLNPVSAQARCDVSSLELEPEPEPLRLDQKILLLQEPLGGLTPPRRPFCL